MRIIDVTTTMMHYPHMKPIQDATIPPSFAGKGGRTGLWVHITTDEGIEGLGVGTGLTAVREVIERQLKDLLVGEDPFNIEKLWNDMFWGVRGFGRKGIAFCAISAVDIGLWDLKAKALQLPLFRLLGPFRDSVPIYGSGGWTHFSERELIEEACSYVDRGWPGIKVKVGKDFGTKEREDLHRLGAVRKAIGDAVEIYIDANNAFSAKQAIAFSRRLEAYKVGWFEEPVLADDIDGLIACTRACDIPIATGEHEYTKFGFKELVARGACDICQPDVGRVGGVTEWMKVAHLAQAFNLPIAPHAVQLVHLHTCCAIPNLKAVEYLGLYEESDKAFYAEIPMPDPKGNWSPFPDKPGLGLALDPTSVKRYRI